MQRWCFTGGAACSQWYALLIDDVLPLPDCRFDLAFRCYRQALSMDPLGRLVPAVRQNFLDFLRRRGPGSLYFDGSTQTPDAVQRRAVPAARLGGPIVHALVDEHSGPRPTDGGASVTADLKPWVLLVDPMVKAFTDGVWELMRDADASLEDASSYYWRHGPTGTAWC